MRIHYDIPVLGGITIQAVCGFGLGSGGGSAVAMQEEYDRILGTAS
ncbi:MAG: hypothetical protein ACE1Y4_05530 [Lysobacterales bacterium]